MVWRSKLRFPTVALFVLLAGCSPVKYSEPAGQEIEGHYKNNRSPASGYSRVYILPAFLSAMLGDFNITSEIFVGKNESDAISVAKITKNQFLAFDIPQGSYFIKIAATNNYSVPSQTFTFAPAKTTILKPLIHENNWTPIMGVIGGPAGILMGAGVDNAVHSGVPQFELVDLMQGMEKIKTMTMVRVSPNTLGIIQN